MTSNPKPSRKLMRVNMWTVKWEGREEAVRTGKGDSKAGLSTLTAHSVTDTRLAPGFSCQGI